MDRTTLPNYLKTYRKRSGLSQREVGILLGYKERGQTPRHEQFNTLPPLKIALAYAVLYRTPVSALFRGMHDTLETTIEKRLAVMEIDLQSRSAKDVDAESTARKLEWMMARRER